MATLAVLQLRLKRGFDFEAPSFQKRLWDVLGVLIAASPLPQTGRTEVLVGGELVFAHDLLKFGDGGDNGTDRLGLAPVRISASLSHENAFRTKGELTCKNRSIYMILQAVSGFMKKKPALDTYVLQCILNVIGDSAC